MEIGFVGLGRMGMNMVERLCRGDHRIVAMDLDTAKVREVESFGAKGVTTLDALVKSLAAPRNVWIMVPAGEPTEKTVSELAKLLERNDTVIDGGNTHYPDDLRRSEALGKSGIHLIDAGTSGGIWGLRNGYCLMIGGEKPIFERLEPIFRTLAPPDGYAYMGSSGAGHYVKMIHNGIEYGMMQAYAEGFECMHKSSYRLDLPAIARLWGQGSVVRSWLLELAASALEKDPALEHIKGYVADSGEGRWTVLDAIEKDVAMPVITLSLFTRFRSRADENANGTFGERLLAALRNEFGGHAVVAR
jgi:6-phosphogluconate dehydrogenase